MKLSKFITKFIFITAFSSIIAAFLISIFFQYQNFKNEFNHYKKEFTEQKKEEVKDVDYSKMTVAELKEVAKEKNINVTGMKKAEIVAELSK